MIKEELKQLIDENEVISFDIFDTLLLRNVHQPSDIFRIVEKCVEKRYQIKDFCRNRVIAEANARKIAKNQETDYAHIYKELEKIYGCSLEEVEKIELEIEYKFIVANPYMKKVWEYAVETGKKVAFISDMYLKSSYIKKLLEKTGYKTDNIYVSCEYQENKGQMGLYEYIYREKKWNKSKWLHIGDNENSDYKKAIEFGISSYHYKNVSSYYKYSKELTIGESILVGIQNNYLFNGEEHNYWENFGVRYAFMIYFAFTKWLYELTREEDNLYFFARDGYIIKEIYDMFCKKESNHIFTKYLYISRKVLLLPELTNDSQLDTLIRAITDRAGFKTDNPTLKEILRTAGIKDYEKVKKYIYAFGFASIDEEVPIEKHYMVRNLIKKTIGEIQSGLLEIKEKTEKYLAQEEVTRWDKINIMDIGWGGNCQIALKQMLNKKVMGYYFGTVDTTVKNEFSNMLGWLFDDRDPISNYRMIEQYMVMYEFLFTAPHGSVIDYEEKESIIKPVFNQNVTVENIAKEFQKASLQISEVAIEYMEYIDAVRPEIACEQYQKYLENKDENDVKKFYGLTTDFMIGSSKTHSYIAVLDKCLNETEIANGNLERMRIEKDRAFWSGAYIIKNSGDVNENIKNLFQYRLEAPIYSRNTYYIENKKSDLSHARIYFDFGNGFSEDNSIIAPMEKNGIRYGLNVRLNLEVKAVRIDPIEQHLIRFKNCQIQIDGQNQEVEVKRAAKIRNRGWRVVRTKDPSFVTYVKDKRISNIMFACDLEIIS